MDGELRQWDIMTEECDFVIIMPGPIFTFLLNEPKTEMYMIVGMDMLCIVNIEVCQLSFVIYNYCSRRSSLQSALSLKTIVRLYARQKLLQSKQIERAG